MSENIPTCIQNCPCCTDRESCLYSGECKFDEEESRLAQQGDDQRDMDYFNSLD